MPVDLDVEKAKKMYSRGSSLAQIAKQFKCGSNTVKRRLLDAGVTLRDKNQAEKDKNSWWQNEDYLKEKYIEEKLSTTQIGELVDASPSVVRTWLVNFEIETRPTGGSYKKGTKMSPESRQKMSDAKKGKYTGAENPNWKGGQISDADRGRRSYELKVWRIACLERDEYQCTICGATDRLHVHHILLYDKYPERRYDVNNGKTVCVLCHEKIHKRQFPDWITGRDKVESLPIKLVERKAPPEVNLDAKILKWLYESNSTAKIAEMLGCNAETIRKKLIKFGISRRPVGGPKLIERPTKSQVLEVYPSKTLRDACKHFGVGQTLFLRWLNELGIERTKKHRKK